MLFIIDLIYSVSLNFLSIRFLGAGFMVLFHFYFPTPD